jgi:hypothetical protein
MAFEMIDNMSRALEPPEPPPLPAALIHAAKPLTTKGISPKRRRWLRKTVNSTLLLVAGGVVSLVVALVTGQVQVGDANQQSRSGHQFQQWQELQSEALNEASRTREIYSFAQQCTDSKMNWQECANLDPNYDTWVSASDVMITTEENTDDQETRQLTEKLATISKNVVMAPSASAASRAEGQLWSAYEVLVGRLGVLIRTH